MDTIDVRDVPNEKVRYLQQLVDLWREQARSRQAIQEEGDVNPSDFIVRYSMIPGGVTRAMAYEN